VSPVSEEEVHVSLGPIGLILLLSFLEHVLVPPAIEGTLDQGPLEPLLHQPQVLFHQALVAEPHKSLLNCADKVSSGELTLDHPQLLVPQEVVLKSFKAQRKVLDNPLS